MSYAAALTSGVSGKRPAVARPKPIAPPPAQKMVAVSAEEQLANAGAFASLLPQHIVKIAVYAGPAALCNLGCACKYLQNQLLNQAVWIRVKDQLPAHPKLGVSIAFDLPAVDVDDDAELKEGGTASVAIGQFSREANRAKLVAYWNEIVSEAQATRSGALDFAIPGGLSVDIVTENSQSVRLYTGEDVADIPVWFDGVHAVMSGQSPYTLKLTSGTATLTRVGRGGTAVVVDAGEKETFNLSDLVIAFRAAGKQYVKVVQRLNSALKAASRSHDETEAAAAQERAEALVKLTEESRISRALTAVSEIVESNKIPDQKFQAAFAKKRADKARVQAQANQEYESMLSFLKGNLPADYAATQKEAERLQEQAVLDEESREARFQERKAARIAEQNAEKENTDSDVAPKKKKKAKAVKVKKTDSDGFVSEVVKVGGKIKKAVVPQSAIVPKTKKSVGAKLLQDNPYQPALDAPKFATPTQALANQAAQKGKSVLKSRGQGKSGTQTANTTQDMPKNTGGNKKRQRKRAKMRYEKARREEQIKSQETTLESGDVNVMVVGGAAVVGVIGVCYYFGLL